MGPLEATNLRLVTMDGVGKYMDCTSQSKLVVSKVLILELLLKKYFIGLYYSILLYFFRVPRNIFINYTL